MKSAGGGRPKRGTVEACNNGGQNWLKVSDFSTLGSVFCVHVDTKSELAVTGGEDDTAFVWKLSDSSQLLQCTGKLHMSLYLIFLSWFGWKSLEPTPISLGVHLSAVR